MVNGRELLIDVEDIENIDLVIDIEKINNLVNILINRLNLNVVKSCSHQFYKEIDGINKKYGYTSLYLLQESHLTFHSYVDERSVSINLYTCNYNTNFDEAIKIIFDYYEKPYITKRFFNR